MIAIATIKYLTAMGCFVLYLNLGGWAVKPLMGRVQRKIADEMGQKNYLRHALVVPRGTHMFRLTKCIGDRNKWTASVTAHMKHMSDKVHKFFAKVVNPARTSADMNPIHENGTLLENLLANDEAPYVALSTDQPSWQNMTTQSHKQAEERGMRVGQALVAKLGDDASKYFSDLGKIGYQARHDRLGDDASEYYSEWGTKNAVLNGLKSMQIDPKALFLSVGDNGGFKSLEDVKRQCKSFGVSFDEAKTRWAEEMNKRQEEKYTPAEMSVMKKTAGKKGAQRLMANLKTAWVSVPDHYANIRANGTSEARSYGMLMSFRKKLIDKGRKLYCFVCNECQNEVYHEDRGNKWEKPKATDAKFCRCPGCKNEGLLPRAGKRESTLWTFKCEFDGDDLTKLHDEWKKQIAEHKKKKSAKKKKQREERKKKKKKKK